MSDSKTVLSEVELANHEYLLATTQPYADPTTEAIQRIGLVVVGKTLLAEVRRLKKELRPSWHGTSGGYGNHGCRCEECRTAHAASKRRRMHERWLTGPPPTVKHGLPSTYSNWGCHCAPCLTAAAEYKTPNISHNFGRLSSKRRKATNPPPVENPT